MPKAQDHPKDDLQKKARELIDELAQDYSERDIRRIGGYLCQAWVR
jgi:hypothetical protein